MAPNQKSPRATEQGYAPAGGAMGPMSSSSIANQPRALLSPEERQQYQILIEITDPVVFQQRMQDIVLEWEKTPSIEAKYENRLNEITSTLRGLKLSKGVGGPGVWTTEDSVAFRKVMGTALASNIGIQAVLEDRAFLFGSKDTTTTFSKSISSALSLLDEGDAKSALSKAYYVSFGFYPSEKQNKDFLAKWNAEVKIQKATTTTSGTSTGKGSGSVSGTSTSVTSGQGFTQEEQADFLAKYLQKNFKLEGDVKGEVKNIYDQISTTAKNNLL